MSDEKLNAELNKRIEVDQSSLVGGRGRRKGNILALVIQGQNEPTPRAAE